MENRFHERDDVSVAGGLENHPIEMHLSKTWRRVQQVQACWNGWKLYLVSTFFREFKHSLLFQIL